jgi:predicted dithiol-disulfide oxidoreductase (DUF899 family)
MSASLTIPAVCSEAELMRHRTRELLSGQRTALINALRGHLAEIGVVVSIAPLAKIEACRKRIGWTLQSVSSAASDLIEISASLRAANHLAAASFCVTATRSTAAISPAAVACTLVKKASRQ